MVTMTVYVNGLLFGLYTDGVLVWDGHNIPAVPFKEFLDIAGSSYTLEEVISRVNQKQQK